VRLVQVSLKDFHKERFDFKKVTGGLLMQEKDAATLTMKDVTIVSKKKPTALQTESILFGWNVVKHIKSNAIVLVKGQKTVGFGVGQTSRVDSAINAIRKAGPKAKGAVLISDAFLPMPDTVTLAAKAGIVMIVQTGGSIKDPDVIEEANRHKIVMAMTGLRHFKH